VTVARGRRRPPRDPYRPKGRSAAALWTVRPAWAQSWRCKSSRELATASEVNPNCGEVTNRGEEGMIETASRCTRTGYEAMSTKASGRFSAKLLWSTVRRRRSGGCAVKDCVLTWGDPGSAPEREAFSRRDCHQEVSSGRSTGCAGKDQTRERNRCLFPSARQCPR